MRKLVALLAMTPAMTVPAWADQPRAEASQTFEAELNHIRVARDAVADMKRLAVKPAERQLAADTDKRVERLALLVKQREAARRALIDANRRIDEAQRDTSQQQFEIQHLMQRYSQTYSAMSNIMKSKHDTAMAAIQKIR